VHAIQGSGDEAADAACMHDAVLGLSAGPMRVHARPTSLITPPVNVLVAYMLHCQSAIYHVYSPMELVSRIQTSLH